MPTIFREGPYRFYFHSHEAMEPAHIHVDRDKYSVKFWLEPVRLSKNMGFASVEVRKLQLIVIRQRQELLGAWNEYFSFGRK